MELLSCYLADNLVLNMIIYKIENIKWNICKYLNICLLSYRFNYNIFWITIICNICIYLLSMSSTSNQGSLSTTGGADASSSMLMPGGGLGSHSNWLQGLDSPLIQEDAANTGQKELKLRFDVSQYTPEEIMVKTVDNKLLVSKDIISFSLSTYM